MRVPKPPGPQTPVDPRTLILGATYMPRMKYMMAPMITIPATRQRSNIRQLMVGVDFLMG